MHAGRFTQWLSRANEAGYWVLSKRACSAVSPSVCLTSEDHCGWNGLLASYGQLVNFGFAALRRSALTGAASGTTAPAAPVQARLRSGGEYRQHCASVQAAGSKPCPGPQLQASAPCPPENANPALLGTTASKPLEELPEGCSPDGQILPHQP